MDNEKLDMILDHLYGELEPNSEEEFLKETSSSKLLKSRLTETRQLLTAYRLSPAMEIPDDIAKNIIAKISAEKTAENQNSPEQLHSDAAIAATNHEKINTESDDIVTIFDPSETAADSAADQPQPAEIISKSDSIVDAEPAPAFHQMNYPVTDEAASASQSSESVSSTAEIIDIPAIAAAEQKEEDFSSVKHNQDRINTRSAERPKRTSLNFAATAAIIILGFGIGIYYFNNISEDKTHDVIFSSNSDKEELTLNISMDLPEETPSPKTVETKSRVIPDQRKIPVSTEKNNLPELNLDDFRSAQEISNTKESVSSSALSIDDTELLADLPEVSDQDFIFPDNTSSAESNTVSASDITEQTAASSQEPVAANKQPEEYVHDKQTEPANSFSPAEIAEIPTVNNSNLSASTPSDKNISEINNKDVSLPPPTGTEPDLQDTDYLAKEISPIDEVPAILLDTQDTNLISPNKAENITSAATEATQPAAKNEAPAAVVTETDTAETAEKPAASITILEEELPEVTESAPLPSEPVQTPVQPVETVETETMTQAQTEPVISPAAATETTQPAAESEAPAAVVTETDTEETAEKPAASITILEEELPEVTESAPLPSEPVQTPVQPVETVETETMTQAQTEPVILPAAATETTQPATEKEAPTAVVTETDTAETAEKPAASITILEEELPEVTKSTPRPSEPVQTPVQPVETVETETMTQAQTEPVISPAAATETTQPATEKEVPAAVVTETDTTETAEKPTASITILEEELPEVTESAPQPFEPVQTPVQPVKTAETETMTPAQTEPVISPATATEATQPAAEKEAPAAAVTETDTAETAEKPAASITILEEELPKVTESAPQPSEPVQTPVQPVETAENETMTPAQTEPVISPAAATEATQPAAENEAPAAAVTETDTAETAEKPAASITILEEELPEVTEMNQVTSSRDIPVFGISEKNINSAVRTVEPVILSTEDAAYSLTANKELKKDENIHEPLKIIPEEKKIKNITLDNTDNIPDLLEKSRLLYNQESYLQALFGVEEILAKSPIEKELIETLTLKARIELKLKDYAEMKKTIAELRPLSPLDSTALLMLYKSSLNQSKKEKIFEYNAASVYIPENNSVEEEEIKSYSKSETSEDSIKPAAQPAKINKKIRRFSPTTDTYYKRR